jgi:hypothetical protein
MNPEKFDLEVNTHIIAKLSPDCPAIQQKANAGVSEKDLIERYTIAELEQEAEEETEEADV